MKITQSLTMFLVLVFGLVVFITGGPVMADELFGSFADDNTIGLWLFDEGAYPHTTLTDASRYEYDLRLQTGGKLVGGKFGGAFHVAGGTEHAISYAGFIGSVPIGNMREKDGIPSGLWGPTQGPEKIMFFNRVNGKCQIMLIHQIHFRYNISVKFAVTSITTRPYTHTTPEATAALSVSAGTKFSKPVKKNCLGGKENA